MSPGTGSAEVRPPHQFRPAFDRVEMLGAAVIFVLLVAVTCVHQQSLVSRSPRLTDAQSMQTVRDALDEFHRDTGLYPLVLSDLFATNPPKMARGWRGVERPVNPSAWQGPYLKPKDVSVAYAATLNYACVASEGDCTVDEPDNTVSFSR